MTAHYSVVQYVPDTIANERMNIGIIVVDEDGALCRFLLDWDRAEMFGGKDVDFLKEFARSVEDSAAEQDCLVPPLPITLNVLEQMAREWNNLIQVTKPRGSILNAEALIASIAGDFLKGQP